MTMDTTPWRRAAACLLAGIGAVLALAWAAGDAHAQTPNRQLRSAVHNGPPGARVISPTRVQWPRQGVTIRLRQAKPDWAGCNGPWVCLWENAWGRGRMIYFKKRGTFKLSAWSMSGDPYRHKGVTSFWNRRGRAATLIGPNFRLGLSNYGNVPSSMNDRATYVRLH